MNNDLGRCRGIARMPIMVDDRVFEDKGVVDHIRRLAQVNIGQLVLKFRGVRILIIRGPPCQDILVAGIGGQGYLVQPDADKIKSIDRGS